MAQDKAARPTSINGSTRMLTARISHRVYAYIKAQAEARNMTLTDYVEMRLAPPRVAGGGVFD